MHRRLGVGGECFLGGRALSPQPGQPGPDGGITAIQLAELAVQRGIHVGEHGVIDVDPAEALQAFGRAEQFGPVLAVAHDRGVERPTSEVEDGDGLAGLEPAEAGVVTGGGLGLGHQLDVVDTCDAAGLPEEIQLELAPVGGMGQRDAVGPLTGLRLGLVDDVAQHMSHQCFGAERGAGEHVGRAVAEAPLELTGTCRGIGRQVALRGVAHDEVAVHACHDRRHGDRVLGELHRFAAVRRVDCGSRPGRAEVNSESHVARPSWSDAVVPGDGTTGLSAWRRADSRSSAPMRRPMRRARS